MSRQGKKKQLRRRRAKGKKEEGFLGEWLEENPVEEKGISNRRF